MAEIKNLIHTYDTDRVIDALSGAPLSLEFSYDFDAYYNAPPFVWDASMVPSDTDPVNYDNLLKVPTDLWKFCIQRMSGDTRANYREYAKYAKRSEGVYDSVSEPMGERIRFDCSGSNSAFFVDFTRIDCVYHYTDGTSFRDIYFDTKEVTDFNKFYNAQGKPLPFYFKTKSEVHDAPLNDRVWNSLQKFDAGYTIDGKEVYGTVTRVIPFTTSIDGTIGVSFKWDTNDTLSQLSAHQTAFDDIIDYVTFEPVYSIAYGRVSKQGTKYYWDPASGVPLGYAARGTSAQLQRSSGPITDLVFTLHSINDAGAHIRGSYRYDTDTQKKNNKYTYVDNTVDYATAFTTKAEALELFDVSYADNVVTVSMKQPARGWMPPYNYSELVSNQDSLCVPFLLLLDDRYSDTDVFNGELMYSDYWRLHPGEQYRATAYPGHVMGLYHVTHVNNLDGTISFSYPLIGDGEGWPTVPFEGSLALSKALHLGKGILDAQDQLVPWNCWSTDRAVFLGDMSNFVYTRDDVHLISGIDAYKGSVNPDNKLAINTQTAFIYKNIDAQYVLTIPLRATSPVDKVTDTPGWGYEVLQGTHVSSSVTGLQRIQNSLDAQFVITADALEDTALEGGNITFKLYKYTGATYDSKVAVAEYDIYFIGEYYQEIVPSVSSVYLTGSSPEKVVHIDTNPATSFIDSLNAECSNNEIAVIKLDDHTLTITQVATGRCTVRVWSTIFPGSYAMITVISGTTEPGGADDEPDNYTNYPVPTDPEHPLEPEARAQHAYFYDLDWRTSQLKQHCGGFDHGIGRGKTFNAAPGTLYIVYSEHSKREYFRDGVRTEGMEDQIGKYIPTPLLQGNDVWHTDYEAPAFLDTGNVADRNGTSNKRFREVQYVLALDGDTDMQVAFAFLVDGAMRRPMLKPVAEYDPEADVITVSTEYDEPYSVAESTVGNLGEWKLDAHTLENAERVRVRQNVTGKGITASTRIVFKMSGQFKLLGVNYVYREMYSR